MPFQALRAVAALSILSGPIYAQIPVAATTDSWTNGGADLLWGNPANWSTGAVPGINEIARFNVAPATIQNINLGGLDWEIGSLFMNSAGATNYVLQSGRIITNSINQNADDPNALDPTALVSSKNSGADVLNVSVSSNTLQLQGQITSGGINKFGGSALRLGTSGTAFDNVINGDITIYGGTLRASAGAVVGVNNPLGGTGRVVIGNAGVTFEIQAQIATGEYDFGRDIVAGNNNFTLVATNASGTDPGDPNVRMGTLFIGNAAMVTNNFTGFRPGFDSLNFAAGSTNSRIHVTNSTTTATTFTYTDGLTGDANSNLYKRGGGDLEIRGNNEASFSGDIYHGESNLRLQSTAAGLNPAGGADSTIFFSNGYGVTALDGGQTLQLRSDATLDYGSNISFRPGVTIGRIDVNRVGTTATGQRLTVGDVNLSGQLLRVLGGNTFSLGIDNINVAAGSAQIFEGATADTVVTGNLNLPAGTTFTKIGGSALTLSSNNSATILGTITHRAGNLIGTVAGSLGSSPIEVGDPFMGTDGFQNRVSRLQVNNADAIANAVGIDATAKLGGIIDINATPNAGSLYAVEAGGMLQGNSVQLGALPAPLLSTDAIILHEQPGDATGTIVGLPSTANIFYGIVATANTLPNVGVGTPWKGVSTDNTARNVQGIDAVTPAILNVEGGDNNPATIEVRLNAMNNVALGLGTTTAADGEFKWNSVTGQKVTVELVGAQGISTLGLVKGGRVQFSETDAVSGLSTHVDKIIISGSSLILPLVGTQGGVPIEIRSGGSLDIGSVIGNVIDGPVTVKSGGVFFFNDAQILGGTGTITFENGSILDISGGAPSSFFTAATNPLTFPAATDKMTVRFAASEIAGLNANIPDNGSTYVVSGGATAAIIPLTNLSVTTNTQSLGITLENGILTNDATSRGFSGPITLNNTNLTVAATRGTSLGVTNAISTTGNVTVGSATAIDGRDKTPNPDRVSGLGLADPYNGSPQVVFVGPFNVGGSVTATGTHIAFADANTNILGDLTVGSNVLYLDGGGPLNGGSAVRGELTARLTSLSGLAADRVADRIILGNYARSEMSIAVGSGLQEITQPFVITGNVNPIDKRTFWVDRADAAGTVSAVFTDILLKNNTEFGIDENNVAVRASLKLDGNAALVRNFDDYDLRNVLRGPSAPANVTLRAGEPTFGWDDATEYLVNGSNATLTTTVDGMIESGVTIDLIRSTFILEQNAVLDGVIRTQTAPSRGDAFLISRSSGLFTATTLAGSGEIQLGRSVAGNGPEDFDVRGTEGSGAYHTVDVPVRVLNDGNNNNIDGVIRSDRHVDGTGLALTQVNTVNVDAGAALQIQANNQARLDLATVNLGANSAIDSMNSTTVFVGNVAGGANTIRFTGPAQTRITGNITAAQINATGGGLDFDAGTGNTSTVTAPIALSGVLSVRSGTADLGTNVITGSSTGVVAGLRESKYQGSPTNFDLTVPNRSNEVQLSPRFANIAATVGWGEQQTVTYTGQINIPDNGTLGDGLGSVAFAKFFDDSVRVQVDGTTVLQNTTSNDSAANASGDLTVGWHDIEIRFGQGVGGAGSVGQDGNAFSTGLGIDLTGTISTQTGAGVGLVIDGSQYTFQSDDGLMSLFRTTTVKASIDVAGDSTLKAGAFTGIGTVTMSGFNSVIGVSSDSDADALVVRTGANSFLSGIAGTSFTFGSLDIADGAILTLTEPPPPSPGGALEFGAAAGDLAGPAAVPEPGSTSLLVAGLAALLGSRRKSKRA